MENLKSREVTQLVNDIGDEIELEILQYIDHYSVTATICPDKPPFYDYIASGIDFHSKRNAMKIALKKLYLKAYYK
ncbi:hypothetical protein [Bacillus sp. 1NLA3E]|uniref:hypothetical protein n=1 Tax=Bacillus sp. 1NLA3E TaxID=666686 RepID=UPI000247E6B3|nr:hypothetical protein [Bacillus sp. 1NLA3E]AGK55912.1 hypothetical protein B1NLA3E_20870 [Bacillus sp. 1NLA3E]